MWRWLAMYTYRMVVDGTRSQSPYKQCLLRRPINVLRCNWMWPERRQRIFDDWTICLSRRCDHLWAPADVDIGLLQEKQTKSMFVCEYELMRAFVLVSLRIIIGFRYYCACIDSFCRDDNICQPPFDSVIIGFRLRVLTYLDIVARAHSMCHSDRIQHLPDHSSDSPTNTWIRHDRMLMCLIRLNSDADLPNTATDIAPDCMWAMAMTNFLCIEDRTERFHE